MEVTYSYGPRYIDGRNIDSDIEASFPKVIANQSIDDPVTGIKGKGYEPGQLNKDGGEL